MDAELLVEQDGPVATLTLNRPHRMNKLTDEILRRLAHTIVALEDDDVTRAVVMRGAGGIFSPGFDVGEKALKAEKRTRADVWDHADLASATFWRIWRSPLPVVAAVNRLCLGGAVYLAAVCDFVVTTPSTEIGMSELKIGMAPPLFNIFPWLMSNRAAREFLYLGEVIDGNKAVEWGLASRCVSEDSFEDESLALARKLAAMPDGVVAKMKLAVRRRWELAGLVTGMAENVNAFVEDKKNMGQLQADYLRLLRGESKSRAMKDLGVDLGLRDIDDPWV
jgi:enoyl-CoA hydratase/carnithine racemase